MKKMPLIAVLSASLLQACCTNLESYRLASDAAVVPPGAFPYALEKTGLTTTFTVTLTGCDSVTDPGNSGQMVPGVQLNVSAVVTQAYGPDSNERYYVDYKKLQSAFKTTTLKIATNNDQTLQSVNAEVNDQSMQVVGAALQSAAQIGGAIMLGKIPVANVPAINTAQFTEEDLSIATPLKSGCSDATKTLLQNLVTATAALNGLDKSATTIQITNATNAVSKAMILPAKNVLHNW